MGLPLPPVVLKPPVLTHRHYPTQALPLALSPTPAPNQAPAPGTVPFPGSDLGPHVSAATLRYAVNDDEIYLW